MKRLISLALALLINSACVKKEQQQNRESQIVELLNQNQSDAALEKINQELSLHQTDELLYLKASALSMKAGVDIYALFPLLKVKIFDVAISQWSQNREFQKKSDAQKKGIVLGPQDIEDQKKGNGKKQYVPLKEAELDYKIAYIGITTIYNRENNFCEIGLSLKNAKTINNDLLWFTTQMESENTCNDILQRHITPDNFEVSPTLDSNIRQFISDNHKSAWFERRREIDNKENYAKVLGSFWTLLDMVPMISKIPKISSNGFKSLEEAQEILAKIKDSQANKSEELSEKSRKQLLMLSALKIIAHVQNAFKLDLIKSPIDLICNSNDEAAEEIVESEKDALYLINAIDDPELIKKNQEAFDDIKNKYQLILQEENNHPEFKELRIKKVREYLESNKKNNCEL